MFKSSLHFENCKALYEYKLDAIQGQQRINVLFYLNTPVLRSQPGVQWLPLGCPAHWCGECSDKPPGAAPRALMKSAWGLAGDVVKLPQVTLTCRPGGAPALREGLFYSLKHS